MTITTEHNIGDFVYLITDPDQHKRMIISIMLNKYDLFYRVMKGTEQSDHYDFELSATPDQNIILGISKSETA